MFSFTLQMADGRAVPFVQYVVSLAVIEGIEVLCKNKVCVNHLKELRGNLLFPKALTFYFLVVKYYGHL